MATDHDGAQGLALADSRVYWGNGEGLIRSTPPDGGDPSPISVGFASRIVVRGDRLYFIDYVENFIKSSSVDGNDAETIVTVAPAETLDSMGVDGEHVYWSLYNSDKGIAYIRRAALDGSAQESLVKGSLTGSFALDGTSLYFGQYSGALTPQAGIHRLDLETGDNVLLAGGNSPYHLTIAGGTLIFSDWDTVETALFRMPVEGGDPLQLSSLDGGVGSLVADDAYVYWTGQAAGGGATFRMPIEGGPPENIATTAAASHVGIAADDAYVYFTRSWTEPFGPLDFEEYGVSVLRWCKAP